MYRPIRRPRRHAIEAMSRGAAFALLVDQDAQDCAIIRTNFTALNLGGAARIFRRDARKLGAVPDGESFSLAFLDPPYGKGLVPPTLKALRDGGWLDRGALAVIEERAGAEVELPEGFVSRETRRFGAKQIVFACLK